MRYLYKIPTWDTSPPPATAPEAVLAKELVEWSKDSYFNGSFGLWQTEITARAYSYLEAKQETSMYSFIGIFIGLIFSLSLASFLYFKLHTELIADMRMYYALSKIGLSVKEMSVSATRQISMLFYIVGLLFYFYGRAAESMVKDTSLYIIVVAVPPIIIFLLIRRRKNKKKVLAVKQAKAKIVQNLISQVSTSLESV